jgi:hypothetical protein
VNVSEMPLWRGALRSAGIMGEALAITPLARWNVMEQAKGTTAQHHSVTRSGLKLMRGHARNNNVCPRVVAEAIGGVELQV